MMKELFINSIEELEELQCQHDLEYCGMSGLYPTYRWYAGEEIDIYFTPEEE